MSTKPSRSPGPNFYARNRAWAMKFADSHKFLARSPVAVRSEEVEKSLAMNIVSVPLAHGIRTWFFETRQERDLFCSHYAHRGALPLDE